MTDTPETSRMAMVSHATDLGSLPRRDATASLMSNLVSTFLFGYSFVSSLHFFLQVEHAATTFGCNRMFYLKLYVCLLVKVLRNTLQAFDEVTSTLP